MDYKSGYNFGNIDLHIHSTASDGSLDPLEILTIAKKAGLKAIALTDHDSVEGSKKILAHRHLLGPVKFLTGVEISAASPDFFSVSGSFHILGYGFDVDHPELNQTLLQQQNARKNRNPGIIARLNELGFDMSLDEVISESEEKAQIGRPHIARVMVKKGFARSIDDAFDTYIGKGKPAYIDKPRVDTVQAIKLILLAGGIPILAHPGLLDVVDFDAYEYLLSELVPMGLKGVEVYYPNHSVEETDYFAELAEKFDLLVTGGSDFHGAINPEIQLGTGKGDLCVPYVIFERLKREINQIKSSP
ncbi:MAG: PHP domain-containing protein [Desulfobacteraceae bacterium]|nr:PHP domain-containing protein [Desulfobacteraceae bacterium]MBC2757720.1 PHP domain-containing protein [Desulfobacteraceae bacterium]